MQTGVGVNFHALCFTRRLHTSKVTAHIYFYIYFRTAALIKESSFGVGICISDDLTEM